MIFIDNNLQDTVNISDFFVYDQGSYQSGRILYPLPYLPEGDHQIKLVVHDNYNNSATDSINFVVNVKPPVEIIPEKISLYQNYPNPFNPETVIPFRIKGHGHYQVKIEIFNILGQRIRRLIDKEFPPGKYKMKWDTRNDQGVTVASGLYIYRLKVSGGKKNYQYARKMLLLR
ncbi:MAG: T9SS type A sorting domain-containing protein [Calditrichae bacterium]|nr:T9SS type A sorting domain-containing protein [Calditrichia bacterium]